MRMTRSMLVCVVAGVILSTLGCGVSQVSLLTWETAIS